MKSKTDTLTLQSVIFNTKASRAAIPWARDRLRPLVFRIEHNTVRGTGFFFQPTLALTAYHVLRDAGLEPGDVLKGELPDGSVDLLWRTPDGFPEASQNRLDIAVLEVKGQAALCLPMIPLKCVSRETSQKEREDFWRSRKVRAFGFLRGKATSEYALAARFLEDTPIRPRPFRGNTDGPPVLSYEPENRPTVDWQDLRGTSGAPLYSTDFDALIGVQIQVTPSPQLAYAVDFYDLREAWPAFAEWVMPIPPSIWPRVATLLLVLLLAVGIGWALLPPEEPPIVEERTAIEVGMTIWKLREPSSPDEPVLEYHNPDTQQLERYAASRLHPDDPLVPDIPVRFTVESSREGYLYLIDREIYLSTPDDCELPLGDGQCAKMGPPLIVFPTTGQLGGDNRVEAKRLIEFPARTDRPPYLIPQSSSPEQIGEMLTVLITARPLDELTLEPDGGPTEVEPEVFEQWREQWEADVLRELREETVGRGWTAEEEIAGGLRPKALIHAVPKQLAAYHVEAPQDQPILFDVCFGYQAREGGAVAAACVSAPAEKPNDSP